MKKITIICGLLLLGVQITHAQSFKDFFNKKNIAKVASTVGVDMPLKLEGTWKYSGAAIKLESDDVLKNAAASVATIAAEEKLNEQLSRVGMNFDSLEMTFKEDNQLIVKAMSREIPIEYQLSEDKKTITLVLYNNVKFDAALENELDNISLLFEADNMLKFVSFVSEKVNNATIKSVAALAKNYDGMKMGFELERVN